MGKRKHNQEEFKPTNCPHNGCERLLKNKNNYDLHVKSCSKRLGGGIRRMESFFTVPTSKVGNSTTSTTSMPGMTASDFVASTSNSDGQNDIPIDIDCETDDFSTTSANGTVNDVLTSGYEPLPISRKCEGVTVDVGGSFYRRYPFHRHDPHEQSYPFQHKIQVRIDDNGEEVLVAHSKTCNTSLTDDFVEVNSKTINKVCVNVSESSSYKKMQDLANTEHVNINMPVDILNHEQLKNKFRDLRKEMTEKKLSTLNLVRKNSRLTKQLSLHKRLIEIIGTNDIPRLSQLIKVCLNSGMGAQSIIGRLTDAIRGKYRANYSEKEKDVAALVYKIGGPRLLHIMHVSHGLPGITTTFNYCKRPQYFSAAVDETFDARLQHNIAHIKQNTSKINTVKMDEIATESRPRWNIADNKILGLCYQHSHEHSMKFESMDDIQRLTGLIEAGTVHLTKETLVVFIGEVGNGAHVDPILTLPSCCKTESPEFDKMISSIFKNVECDILATDGDPMRRKTFCRMSKPIHDQQVKAKLGQCPLFDINIVNGEKGVYFDDKHCAKRFRAVLVSESRGCKVDGLVIARDQLLYAFQKAGLSGYKEALNPSDRQNVAAVLKLHELIQKAVDHGEVNSDSISEDMLSGLKCVSMVFDCILCAFSQPTVSLKEQLTKFSTLSHALLYLYKRGGTNFIPGQLYHDLQRMVQGAYYAAALLQKRGGGKLFIYQLGTDQAETSFASVRTVTHSRNCDALELCHRLHHAHIINDILLKHPTWKRCHGRRLGGSKDYSSEREWTGDLEVNHCVLHDVWLAGRSHAAHNLGVTDDFFNDLPAGVNMLRPNKRLVGVTIDVERTELDLHSNDLDEGSDDEMNCLDLEVENAAKEIEESLSDIHEPSSTIIHSNTIEHEGKSLFKVSIMKEFFGGDGFTVASTDRLKRVRGYSKFPEVDKLEDVELDLDEAIMVGDFVAGKVIHEKQSTFCIAKILSMKEKESGKFKTIISSDHLNSIVVTGRLMPAKVSDEKLVILSSRSLHEFIWEGANCTTIDMNSSSANLVVVRDLLSHLPLASSKSVSSSFLPYDTSLVDASYLIPLMETLLCKLSDK